MDLKKFFSLARSQKEPSIQPLKDEIGDLKYFFSNKELKKIMLHNIGIMTFMQCSSSDFLETTEGVRSDGTWFFDYTSDLKKHDFWLKEKPRKGKCFVLNGYIPGTRGATFLEQTKLLAKFIEDLFPEIKKTDFWKRATHQLAKKSVEIEKLVKKGEYQKALQLLIKLEINKKFRPTFVEIFQQLTAYEKINEKYFLGKEECLWTNTPLYKKSFIFVGYNPHHGTVFTQHRFPSRRAGIGCPFVCSLNFLKKIL